VELNAGQRAPGPHTPLPLPLTTLVGRESIAGMSLKEGVEARPDGGKRAGCQPSKVAIEPWPGLVPGIRCGRLGYHPAGSHLLVAAAELGEADGQPDERVTVAGGDRGGAFDHGGCDRVVAGGVTASLDADCRVRVVGEHGSLRPQRGIPRPPPPAPQ
jgi:hypothetical protein